MTEILKIGAILFCFIVVLCIGLGFYVFYSISKENTIELSKGNLYKDIVKIKAYSHYKKGMVIDNPQQVKELVNEINNLVLGKWNTTFGKEGSSIIHVDLYDKDNQHFRLGLYKDCIVIKSGEYRQLSAKGLLKEFDMDKTPELKKIYDYFNSKD